MNVFLAFLSNRKNVNRKAELQNKSPTVTDVVWHSCVTWYIVFVRLRFQ